MLLAWMARTEGLAASKRWEDLWRSPPPVWLRGLSRLYALGWRAYAGVYALGLKRRARMPVPVIGVGSLWAGGVGKTPVTIAVARLLQESGVRVAVLTHGYGGSRYRTGALIDPLQHPDPAEVGDEAAELRLALPNVPIAVGKQRVQTAHAAIARWSPDALVLDDGFQHLPLARALDLVLLPAESPLGNGYCLPAGPLRETPEGVRRAGGVVWVQWEQCQLPPPQPSSSTRRELGFLPRVRGRLGGGQTLPTYTATIAPTALMRLATGERLSLDSLRGQPLTIVCGIARPQRFLQMADLLGYTVAEAHAFPDHHAYTPDELYKFSGKTLLTTLKDAVKLRGRLPDDCDAYALLIEAQLDDALHDRILSLFTGTPEGRRES
jgi:tetraacyldisaccharide 4'-kinase